MGRYLARSVELGKEPGSQFFLQEMSCRIANARIPKASGFGAGRHEALSHQVCELVHGAPFEGGTRSDELLVKRETI